MIPRATYRVQFHAGFPFNDAIPLAGYWAKLGISHVYASPIGTARTKSMHGYDQVDPTTINPELGGEEGFRALAAALKAEGLGIIIDIVPNHVAVGHGDNDWWLDVLEKGEASDYARFFDIDWHAAHPDLDGKLLAPFLGNAYGEVLGAGALQVKRVGNRLAVVAYDSHVFPLRPEDQATLADEPDLATRFDGKTESGRAALHELCERQHWRLASWRAANDAINWRRFFDITELAGIRIEDDAVFDAIHAMPLRLYREGLIAGVRVDHVDGLADPAAYCRKLRATFGDDAYIVVEKILGAGETLATDWGIDGTSGYDFLNAASALLHDPAGAEPLGQLWHDLSGRPADFAEEEHPARRDMVSRGFAGQLDSTALAFARLAASDIATRDLALPALRRAIAWLLEVFPVYRTYGTGNAAPETDAPIRDRAIAAAKRLSGPAEVGTIDRIGAWLAGKAPGNSDLCRDAMRRFQQLSAPIAAKAVEDTAFYRYGRLLSRNDVGCDPERLGADAAAFAHTVAARSARHPHAMLTTATHDHKRGEDVRMRLAVLSEIPARWAATARAWGADVPEGVDRGDAHMLHQMVVGAWPLDLAADDADGIKEFADRLAAWQVKALREAKLRSSWAAPDEAYEQACADYLQRLLAPGRFAREAQAFAETIAPAGAAKSLAQTMLRATLPGVPDCYQGSEGWDFSLVDPDNRRPVDYPALQAMLAGSDGNWHDGASKQRLLAGLLGARAAHPDLFAEGGLTFLEITGTRSADAIAFARTGKDGMAIMLCAIRCSLACIDAGSPDPGRAWWGDTHVVPADDTRLAAVGIVGNRAVGFVLRS
jgi:(1->4)-alpha-D-glucan 1-alpha-D-glucosylmutase